MTLSLPFPVSTLHAALTVLKSSYDLNSVPINQWNANLRSLYSTFVNAGAIVVYDPGNSDRPHGVSCDGSNYIVPLRGVHVTSLMNFESSQFKCLRGNLEGRLWYSKFSTPISLKWCEIERTIVNTISGPGCASYGNTCGPLVKVFRTGARQVIDFDPATFDNKYMTVTCLAANATICP